MSNKTSSRGKNNTKKRTSSNVRTNTTNTTNKNTTSIKKVNTSIATNKTTSSSNKNTITSRSILRKEKKKKKIIRRISVVASLILILSTILFTYKLLQINMIPNKYLIPVLILIGLGDALLIFFLVKRNIKIRFKVISMVIVLFVFIFDIIVYGYMDKAFDFLATLKTKGIQTENYQVLVLSDSEIYNLEDLKGKLVSYVKTLGNSHKAMEELKLKTDIVSNNKTDTGELISGLLNKSLPAILIAESSVEMIKDQYETEGKDFSTLVRAIHTIKIEIKEEKIVKEVDVTNDTFALYISGIDTFGDISTVSRSDVNIVAVVNPKTKQVLLISIPRDYYVKLHGIETDMRDKLTHAGMYGIETSVKTIEDILDIDINYYLKVNFTSLVDIVDALGGIEVDSKYAFSTANNYSFKKGINKLDGKSTLYFCRERKSFSGGDRVRGQNQQAVITAIIKKAATPSIITKYDALLRALEGKFQTNISSENISKLIKMQLNDMASWNIKSISLDGSDKMEYTYSYPKSMGNSKTYVMEPNIDTIKRAQDLINDIKGNLILDSVDENKVYKTYDYNSSTTTNSKKSSTNSSKSSSYTSINNSSNKSSSLNNINSSSNLSDSNISKPSSNITSSINSSSTTIDTSNDKNQSSSSNTISSSISKPDLSSSMTSTQSNSMSNSSILSVE